MLIRAIWYFISSLWSVEQLKPDSANRYPKVEVEISAHQRGTTSGQRTTWYWVLSRELIIPGNTSVSSGQQWNHIQKETMNSAVDYISIFKSVCSCMHACLQSHVHMHVKNETLNWRGIEEKKWKGLG